MKKKEFGVVRIPKKQESVSSVSEVVSLFTATQVLQMRGGADADEKMGQDASPNPRAMCCNFQLSAHCQVCQRQLLGHVEALRPAWCSKEEPGGSERKCKPQSCAS